MREAIVQLSRNTFLTLTTIGLGTLILFLLNVVFGIRALTNIQLEELEKRADFIVLLEEDYDTFDLKSLQNEIDAYAVETMLLPATQWQDINLPPRMRIIFKDLSDVAPVFETIKKTRYDSVLGAWNFEAEREFTSIIENLLRVKNIVNTLARGAVLLFIFGGGLLAVNTFRIALFTRRKSVYIARLVGAKLSFITLPYYIEALIIGFVSALLAIVLFISLLTQLEIAGIANVFGVLWARVFPWQVLCAGGVGVVGAWTALQPYIRGRFTW